MCYNIEKGGSMNKNATPQNTNQNPVKDYINKQPPLNDINSNILETEYKERRLYEYKVAY